MGTTGFFGGEIFGEVFLKELAGFGAYEIFEVEFLDLPPVFFGQSPLFIDGFEMIHDSIKQHVGFVSIQLVSSSVDLERPAHLLRVSDSQPRGLSMRLSMRANARGMSRAWV